MPFQAADRQPQAPASLAWRTPLERAVMFARCSEALGSCPRLVVCWAGVLVRCLLATHQAARYTHLTKYGALPLVPIILSLFSTNKRLPVRLLCSFLSLLACESIDSPPLLNAAEDL